MYLPSPALSAGQFGVGFMLIISAVFDALTLTSEQKPYPRPWRDLGPTLLYRFGTHTRRLISGYRLCYMTVWCTPLHSSCPHSRVVFTHFALFLIYCHRASFANFIAMASYFSRLNCDVFFNMHKDVCLIYWDFKRLVDGTSYWAVIFISWENMKRTWSQTVETRRVTDFKSSKQRESREKKV